MSYEVKGRTTKIHAVSRCAISIHNKATGKDNYYTIELSEEREMPEDGNIDLNNEYEALFNSINAEVDRQMEDIIQQTKQ